MATVIKFRWHVDELANVMSLFDVQRVYRAVASPSGPWVALTGPGTDVPLVVGVEDYLYDDVAGDPNYYYACTYYNSVSANESAMSDAVRGDLAGYCTVQDVRDAGYPETEVPSDKVVSAIALASQLIERVTGLWFEPRARTFNLNGRDIRVLRIGAPIIAVTAIHIDAEPVALDSFSVYNRHLTEGLPEPDDRADPRIEYTYGVSYFPSNLDLDLNAARFPKGTKNVTVTGYFGFTELGPYDAVGETTPGSQVPKSYGRTPDAIRRACLLLTCRYMWPLRTSEGDDLARRGLITEERTRDQSVSYARGTAAALATWASSTGDPEVDALLALYRAPMRLGAV
jgi:hypothetical protein